METLESSAFADIDQHFARFIARFGGDHRVALAALHLSRAVRQGHICLDLAAPMPSDSPEETPWPTLSEWRDALSQSRAVAAADAVVHETPLVLDSAGRLYLRRYFEYQQALAKALCARAGTPAEAPAEGQAAAIETALTRQLTLISGGPGTGKTTTVVEILAKLLDCPHPPRVALTAPTGKAAARLEQAVRAGLEGETHGKLLTHVPHATTLHRLLGVRSNSPQFRHHAGNPLVIDVLVVDESSMVPLPLMAKLFDALPPHARVILLGDRDQLASVEPGSVLADIADAASLPGSPLQGSLVMLRTNYRFGNESAIYRLSEAVRLGDTEAFEAIESAGDLSRVPLPPPQSLPERLREPVLGGYGPYLRESGPAQALKAFNRFRVLCALRKGPYGVEELNRQIEAVLREARLIRGPGDLHAGMPVLVTQNDYQLKLFNGDIGIVLPDPAQPDGPLWAWFPAEGGAESGSAELRRILPAQIPPHEPAYAMTVHKSQGSEFDRVLLVLPERDTPVLGRELIYTGLTRARNHVEIWFERSVFARAAARRTQRASGLRDALGKVCE